MEFRRINGLPPYVFAQINGLKAEARAAGRDIVDFGFGNPDLPSPDIAVGIGIYEITVSNTVHMAIAKCEIPFESMDDHRVLA